MRTSFIRLFTGFIAIASLHAADDAKPPAKAQKPKRPAAVGPAIGENKATPISRIKVAKDFKVELLYSVPGETQGSWVNLCADDKGRIYASDQYGGLYRFTPPAPGQPLDPKDVQKVPADIRGVNGMVFAFGASAAWSDAMAMKLVNSLMSEDVRMVVGLGKMGMMEWLGNAEYFAPLTESGNRKSGFNAEAR